MLYDCHNRPASDSGHWLRRELYDRVQWPLPWRLLQRLVVQGDMLRAIQSLYRGCLLSMRVGSTCGQSHNPSIPQRQGYLLRGTLFGLFIDDLHHHLQTTCPDASVTYCYISSLRLSDLVYADEICLMASSPAHLQALTARRLS